MLLAHQWGMRLARWDHAGTVVTTAFDVTDAKGVEQLADIIRRIGLLTEVQLGLDTTMQPILPDDTSRTTLMDLCTPREEDLPWRDGTVVDGDIAPTGIPRQYAFVRALFAESLREGPAWVFKATVADGRTIDMVVGTPLKTTADDDEWSGTRRYICFAWQTREFFFVKDAWRVDAVRNEADTLCDLKGAHVSHIPTLVCAGDVYDETWTSWDKTSDRVVTTYQRQVTKTQLLPGDLVGENGAVGRTHQRLVFKEIHVPLDWVRSGKALVGAIKDCVLGKSRQCEACIRSGH